jgi:DNA-binding CsgD family transcriptional regulator
MTQWPTMDTAPRDRLILVHCGGCPANPLKIVKWIDGWVNYATGEKIGTPTGWQPIPDWSNQSKRKVMDKKMVFSGRDLSIYRRRKAGETNQAIANTYKISISRVSQLFQRVNKKMFDSSFYM